MDRQGKSSDQEGTRLTGIRNAFLWSLPQAERQARSLGLFFGTLGDIWELERLRLPLQAEEKDDWFQAIERSEEQGTLLYSPTNESQSEDSDSSTVSLTNTCTAQNEHRTTRFMFDMFQNDTAKRAHLGFSDAPECHQAYGFLAQAATGRKVDTPLQRLKLLNGVKHHKLNKMFLERQGDYYDGEHPVLILVPILDIGDVLNWNGTDEYDVLAITTNDANGISCSKKVLEAAPSTCDPEQARKATELLRCFSKAIASSVVRNDDVGESFQRSPLDFNLPPVTNLKKWYKYRWELQSNDATIGLPKFKSAIDWDKVKIARAKASRNSSLPDPFNMAVKAAINLSAILEAKIMPGSCDEPSWYGEEDGEMNSEQGEEIQRPPPPRSTNDDLSQPPWPIGWRR